MQLELPFDKEIESQRYVKDINGEYIYVKLKDRYEIQVGELVMCTKGDEMIIGYAEVLESDCIMLRHSLIGEKYENTTWLMLNLWSIVKASKFRQSEYENKCKKHGYQIVKGDKVKYMKYGCDITIPLQDINKLQEQFIENSNRLVQECVWGNNSVSENWYKHEHCRLTNNTPNNFRNYYKNGVIQEIKESFKSLLNIK